jgi:adenine-specific DNA-methyltransferase
MGSKRALAPSIAHQIDQDHPRSAVLDVFAGMCAVGTELAPRHPVFTNDIHAFAQVVADALFVAEPYAPTSLHARDELIARFNKNKNELSVALSRRLRAEDRALSLTSEKTNGWKFLLKFNDEELQRRLPNRINGLASLSSYRENPKSFPYCLFSSYFASAYFSIYQAIEIDSLRYAIDLAPAKHRSRYLYALIQAASHCAAAPGHFAQFLIPRDRENTKYIARLRTRSIFERFLSALDSFPRPTCLDRKRNRTFQSDATLLLQTRADELPKRKFVIYADPPYSRAQYSRYYHVLETLVLYDYPKCSSKGRYRENRFVTDFSRKSRVAFAMEEFIAAAAATEGSLYISYPRKGLLSDAGVSLRDLLKRYFEKVKLVAQEPLHHSTMGGAPGAASMRVLEDIYYGGWK